MNFAIFCYKETKTHKQGDIKTRTAMHKLRIIVAVIITLAWSALPAHANPSIFTVERVVVDEVGKNAASARNKAITSGQEQAFYRLLRRITPYELHYHLPKLEPKDINPMVQGFEVQDERIASTRYQATMSIRFNPEYIRAVLKDHNIAFTEQPSPATLIIPMITIQGKTELWGDANPWLAVWGKAAALGGDMLRLILPLGDLEDIQLANPANLRFGTYDQLKPLMHRYHAKELVVIDALYGNNRLHVNMRHLRPAGSKVNSVSFNGKQDEAMQNLLQNAANDIIFRLENEWKAHAMHQDRQTLKMHITVPYRTLKEWLVIQKKLKKMAFFQQIKVYSIASFRAELEIAYRGTLDQLLTKLNQHHFYLMEQGDRLLLRSSG